MNIQEIFDKAKENMLKDGEHRPLLLVESVPQGMTMIVFADFDYESTLDKQKALFGIAMKYAKEFPGNELRQVAFITEAWISRDPKCKVPSQDPNRREAICVWTLSVDGRHIEQGGHMAEIIRHGKILDLAPYSNLGKITNKLLLAFLAGYTAGSMSDEELSRTIASL